MSQKRFTQTRTEFLAGQALIASAWGHRTLARVIGLLLVVLLAGDSAFADFLVQPMLVRQAVTPGRRYTRELKLENTDPKIDETLTMHLLETTQTTDGSWAHLPSDDPNLSKYSLRSCKGWLTVPPGEIKVGAYQVRSFILTIDVPAGARGFYFAAILVAAAPRDMTLPSGVIAPVGVRYMVPVILEVQGAPMQRDVKIGGVTIEYQAPTPDDQNAHNNLFVDLVNSGGTFSRLGPIVRIWNDSGGHWQWLSEVKYPELLIMPGAKLHVKADAGQMLPSGKYQLEVFLYVDGRREDIIKRTMEFKSGDPSVAAPPGQVVLKALPATAILDSLPGSARSQVLQIANMSEEDVQVKGELTLPDGMQSAQIGQNIRGDDLGCQTWVTLTPTEFTLKGHARRNVTVVAKMPKDATKYRDYYATVKLHLTYKDGKPAGTKEIVVCMQNAKVKDEVNVAGRTLTIAELSPSRYLASALFSNFGVPYASNGKCLGYLNILGAGGGGASTLKRFVMSSEATGQDELLLPLDTRTFSGTLDISDVAEGTYYLTAIFQCDGSPADGVQKQIPIRVYEQGGVKKAQMVNATGLAPLTIKL